MGLHPHRLWITSWLPSADDAFHSWLDYQLHGLHPGWRRCPSDQCPFDTASVILLLFVLRQMTGALWRSAFVAAVFAIHPLRVESVAWVSEPAKDVLSTFFFHASTLGAYATLRACPQAVKFQIPARYYYAGHPASVRYGPAVQADGGNAAVRSVAAGLLAHCADSNGSRTGVPQPEYFGIPKRLILEKIPLLALAAGACAMTVLAARKWIVTSRAGFLACTA